MDNEFQDIESDMECSDNDGFDDDYYNIEEDNDMEQIDPSIADPEYFIYECLTEEQVECLLNESVEILSNNLHITPSLAKVLLHAHSWAVDNITTKYRDNACNLLVNSKIKPNAAAPTTVNTNRYIHCPVCVSPQLNEKFCSLSCGHIFCKECWMMHFEVQITQVVDRDNACNLLVNSKIKTNAAAPTTVTTNRYIHCPVCVSPQLSEKFCSLSCGHIFCKECWMKHFEVQITQGISTAISCMARECEVLAPEDFVLKNLTQPDMREKYQQFSFQDYVKSHPELRFCPGPNCSVVIRSSEPKAKRSACSHCKSVFCFKCGMDYHAPTDCQVIKKWLTKCADDSETANYISAHTKDCPKCHICIEKNGGCNHMQCYNCKHDFCWMCIGDWKSHGSEYYECSRYKENPNIAHESVHAQAREALKKYLHYYERWENHSKSLKLEVHTLEKLKNRINQKVMAGLGTWIDWQYLFVAASLLAKCRYTLQYTYPYAYFMEPGPRKELFEYQQAQLEAEIENLSWKIERAETTDRGDLENQMDIAEKRRTTLLKDFLDV